MSSPNHFRDSLKEELVSSKKLLCENKPVSDCGIRAPRLNGSLDKKTRIAHDLAYALFPPKDDSQEMKVYSYIKYSQLVSSLSKAYRTQEEKARKEEREKLKLMDSYRQARVYGNKDLFNSLLDAPIGQSILHPEPMPVEIAPLEELEPFFAHMRENRRCEDECRQFIRGAYYDDGRIDMCKQVVGDSWIGKFVDSIKDNPHVKHFLMGNNIVDLEGARRISGFIANKHVPKIKTWYLAGNRIDVEGAKYIADALKNDHDCKALWLKRNPLMPEGVRALGKMLEVNRSIEILDLVNVGMLDEGAQHLFESLKKNTTLKILYIDANGLTPKTADYISNYFEYMANNNLEGITSLFLAINRLGDEGVSKIAKGLMKYHLLTRLDLASNRITARSLGDLLTALDNHKGLIYLDLGLYKSTSDMKELPNYLEDDGADLLVDFIKRNESVQILSLQDGNVGPNGLKKVIEAVGENQTLLYVYCGQYGYCSPKHLLKKLWAHLEDNCQRHLGIDLQKFKSEQLRFYKHTERVKDIDSIYRNNM